MNADGIAEWFRRQGHQVIRSESSFWYNAGPRVFQAFPYHWVIQPTEHELRQLMLQHNILALRYSVPWNSPTGIASYHVVLNGPYGLEMLRPQARNGVKRGLATFQIEPISLDRLADEGWRLQKDTLERQNRTSSMPQEAWQRLCLSAKGLDGFEAWGAIVHGELAGSLLVNRVDNICTIPYAQSQSKYLHDHVNNALFYTVCCNLLARKGVKSIFFCLHSLDAPDSVNEFKFRMNFNIKPVRQRVDFHPLLQPFANSFNYHLVARLLKQYPGSYIYSKAEGMLRFHLLGKQPLFEQEWPQCMQHLKSELANPQINETIPLDGYVKPSISEVRGL